MKSSFISDYIRLKNNLSACIDDMLTIENIRSAPCEELRDKIKTDTFNLVVVGQFKRGKTSLINALLENEILPVSVVPLTSIVTIMTYGEALRAMVYFNDERIEEISPGSIHEYVTEKGNPKNEKDVREVVLTYPSSYLKDGVRLIDTPGVGSIYQHNTDIAYRYLPKSDAALFLLSVDQPMSKSEIDFLHDVKEYSNKIMFLLNKIDYLCEKDLNESVEFSVNALAETMGSEVKLFPVSARFALEGYLANSEELVQKSRLPVFKEELNKFLVEEKGNILILSAANSLLRMLSQATLELEIEVKAISAPLEELKEKLRAFEEKKRETELEKQDFDILLKGETLRLAKALDDDLHRFKTNLLIQEEERLDEMYNKNRSLSLSKLRSMLEEQVVINIKNSFNTWRTAADERIAKSFENACKRFIISVDETVDMLLRFSSDLFDVPFDAVRVEAVWSGKTGLYYKFRDEPVGIEILASTVTLALPKFIGDRLVLKKMKEYLNKAVSMQCGRIGYDFERRLDKSRLDFRWEMLRRIDATIEGIATAIKKGMTQREKGEQDVSKRKEELDKTARKQSQIKASLMRIKKAVDGRN
ncbi:MAG: dynamin family protein [Desulfobacterales bacterium]